MASASGLLTRAAEHPVNCPSCGFVNATAARYCGGCGKAFGDVPGGWPVSSSVRTATSSQRLRNKGVPAGETAPMPSMQRARDGSVLRWGEADMLSPPAVIPSGTPATVAIAVSPVRPSHAVTVDYRVNGGLVRQAVGLSEPRGQMRTGACFGRCCRGNPTERSSSCRCSASPASRSLPASRSRSSIPVIGWAAALYRSRPRTHRRRQAPN